MAATCALDPDVPHWLPPIAKDAVESVGAKFAPRAVCELAPAVHRVVAAVAIGSVDGEATPENVTGCGEETGGFVGDAGCQWAPTRAPVWNAARKSTSPPRASVHVDALVISTLVSADSNFNFGKR